MLLSVTPEIRAQGLSTAVLTVKGIESAASSRELLAMRRAAARRIANHWKNRSISSHPAIREYHRVHEFFGVPGEPPAPEKLILHLRRNKALNPTSGLVDCYNIVSARTLLSIGAHDLDQLDFPIALRRLGEKDVFQPLGTGETQRLPGEFGYVDPNGYVICRMDVLQCEWSKVTKDTRNAIVFIQGNRFLAPGSLLTGTWLLAEMASRFCGAEVELVHFSRAGQTESGVLAKPVMTFNTFQSLNLVVATVLKAETLDGMSLSVLTVRSGPEFEALAATDHAEAAVGQKVLVAIGLHPLLAAGRQFTAYVPMLQSVNADVLPALAGDIPEGQRVY